MLVSRRAVLVAIAVCCTLAAAPSAQAYDELNPGGVPKFGERVAVNVVFVGFNEDDAPWAAVRSQLASGGSPIVRSRSMYGITERLGLDYAFDYRPTYTSRAWEDGFFSHLASLAVPKPLAEPQVAYNEQQGNVLDVTSNAWIDAPRVEKRLIDARPPASIRARPRSSSSTGTAAATSASTSTRRPASPTPTPATTSARCATTARWSPGAGRRPMTRKPGTGAAGCAGCGSTTCPPAPRSGAGTSMSTTPTSTATTWPTTAFPSSGSTGATDRAAPSHATLAR